MSARRPSGFTLVEVIVAIVLSTIAMAAILPLLGTVFMASHEPLTQMVDGLALQSAMEELVAWNQAHSLPDLMNKAKPEGAYYDQTNEITTVHNRFLVMAANNVFSNAVLVTETNLLIITIRNKWGETASRLFSGPATALENPE